MVYNVFGCRALGNGTDKDTEAIEKTIDICPWEGRGKVVLQGKTVRKLV